MSEQYVVGLGFGGSVESCAKFEWEFRKQLGIVDTSDESAWQSFFDTFKESFQPEQPIVIVLDDLGSPLFRAFMEWGKYGVHRYENLYVFIVLEDTFVDPHMQFFLNIETDPLGESFSPNQIHMDGEGVPKEALLWMQDRLSVRFYSRDDQMMMEFPLTELPVIS